MFRRCFAILALLAIWLHAAAPATVRAATDTGPEAGESVPVVTTAGTEVAQIAVGGIREPYAPPTPVGGTPEPGFHFAAIALIVENTGTKAYKYNHSRVRAVDTSGVAYRSMNEEITEGSDPFLLSGEAAPGELVAGVIVFQIADGAEIDSVVFIPRDSFALTIVGGSRVVGNGGTAFPVKGASEDETAEVTVNSVTDPDDAAGAEVEDGFHVLSIESTIVNTGAVPFAVVPESIVPVDAQGFVGEPVLSASTTPLPFAEPIPAGESATAVISFTARDAAPRDRIVYRTDGMFLPIAIAAQEGRGGSGTSGNGGESSPVAEVDCNAVGTWVGVYLEVNQGAIEAVQFLYLVVNDGSFTDYDADMVREWAADLDDAATRLGEPDVPDVLSDFAEVVIGMFAAGSGEALNLAAAMDAGDVAGQDASKAAINEALFGVDVFGPFEPVAAACPEETSFF